MYARVTTIEGAPDKMDAAARHVREQTLPQLQQMDRFGLPLKASHPSRPRLRSCRMECMMLVLQDSRG